MKGLTSRQQEVLDMLITYQRVHGFPPTIGELAGMMGVSSPNAAAIQLKALQKKGTISLKPGVSRGITINMVSVEDQAISLLRSLVGGEEYAREHAVAFLESRGVQV
ncbi:LexA family transcriptional regulator [Citrobacter braakii]|uniref:LexA family protein n=1 Tax=Citrobacter braakii TaxID=57706 RepID=UPI0039B42AA2